MENLQECDIEIRQLKFVKGQWLCKLNVGIDVVDMSPQAITISPDYQNDWYKDLVSYLKLGQFPIMMLTKRK